ncbi:MAG: cation-transporting P-type ATPase, partial [Steroidobacteraceae bacterium]
MNQPPSVTPNAATPQPAGDRAAKRAAEPESGILDLASTSLPELLQQLHSSDTGLSATDAAAALKSVGPNRIDSAKPKRLLADFLGRFRNPLVLILLGAAAVSAFTGDVPSFVIITIIVLGSVILDLAQERRAENAAERLREQVSLS